jgi:hypothetical protein
LLKHLLRLDLGAERPLLRGLAPGDGAGDDRDPVSLAARREPDGQARLQPLDVTRPPVAQARAHRAEPLVPGREVSTVTLERGVSLEHYALVFPQHLAVGRPERRGLAVDVLPPLAHRPPDDAQAVGGIHRHLEAAVIRPRRHLAAVHPQMSRGRGDLHFQLRGPLPVSAHPARGQPFRSAADQRRHLIGAERPAAGEQRHRLQERRLALGVAAHEDVQAGIQRQPHVFQVPHVRDLHRLDPHPLPSFPKAASA